jgi:hypothetical protein
MKKWIPIFGMFKAEYPIKDNVFPFFFVYQISSLGIATMIIGFSLLGCNC